jgi:hypothetical protein
LPDGSPGTRVVAREVPLCVGDDEVDELQLAPKASTDLSQYPRTVKVTVDGKLRRARTPRKDRPLTLDVTTVQRSGG